MNFAAAFAIWAESRDPLSRPRRGRGCRPPPVHIAPSTLQIEVAG